MVANVYDYMIVMFWWAVSLGPGRLASYQMVADIDIDCELLITILHWLQ